MRKKKNVRKKVLLLFILLIVILISLASIIDDDRKLTDFEKVIKDTGITISNFISTPFLSIKKIFIDNNKYNEKISNIENMSLNNEIIKENIELKKTLKLNNTLSDREYINATVINRNIGYWFNEITIDKGENSGIEENMAVITSDGLIGKTIKVSEKTSIIKLLTNENMENKISVKIEYEDKFIYGLLSNYKDGFFIVDGISNNMQIKEGAMVTTSGLTDLFPSGVLIGYVESITTDNFDLSQILNVKSNVDFNDIYYVTILKRSVDGNYD